MERGLAPASISALMWEGRYFLSWYAAHNSVDNFSQLNIKDVDTYFAMRAAAGLRRRSLKGVAERLRSLTRFLYRTGRVGVDLTPRIIGPVLYAYESIPSALTVEQISAVLKYTRQDRSPMGYRDCAILLLLSTYGLRDGEIKRLRLEDIDWRAETLHIRHSKTGANSQLPLLDEVFILGPGRPDREGSLGPGGHEQNEHLLITNQQVRGKASIFADHARTTEWRHLLIPNQHGVFRFSVDGLLPRRGRNSRDAVNLWASAPSPIFSDSGSLGTE